MQWAMGNDGAFSLILHGLPFFSVFRIEGSPVISIEGLPVSRQEGLPVSRQEGLPVSSMEGLTVYRQGELPVSSMEEMPVSSMEGLTVYRQGGLPVYRQWGLPVYRQWGLPVYRQGGLPVISMEGLSRIPGYHPNVFLYARAHAPGNPPPTRPPVYGNACHAILHSGRRKIPKSVRLADTFQSFRRGIRPDFDDCAIMREDAPEEHMQHPDGRGNVLGQLAVHAAQPASLPRQRRRNQDTMRLRFRGNG